MMVLNHHDPHQPHNSGLLQDGQGHWDEMLSTTQVLTGEQNLESNKKNKTRRRRRRKKCRGDRKAQHLRRRERRRQQKVNDNDDSEGKKQEQIQVCF